MPVTDWATAGTVSGTGWSADSGTLVSCLETDDDVRATHATGNDNLICTNFGFSLPTNAVVEGVEARFQARTDGVYVGGTNAYLGLTLTKDASAGSGDEKESSNIVSGSEVTETLGSDSDLWGTTLTDAEVEDANFGFLLARGSSSNESPTRGRQVDLLEARVHYSEAASSVAAISNATLRRIPGIGIRDIPPISKGE